MEKTSTYLDEGRASAELLPEAFPEEAIEDGDVLFAESAGAGEATSSQGHMPLGSERSCILGMNVELLRKGAKISKVRFCSLVGISRPMLDKIERGESNPRLDLLESLARVLGVKVADLITPPFDDVAPDFYRKSREKKPPKSR